MACGSSRRRSGRPGGLLRGTVCGDATARVPRPPAHLRRTTPPADPCRVRAALQRTSPAPVARTTTSAVSARPASRHHRPDQAQAGRPRVDQRVSESGLTSTENTSSEPLCEFWHGTGRRGFLRGWAGGAPPGEIARRSGSVVASTSQTSRLGARVTGQNGRVSAKASGSTDRSFGPDAVRLPASPQ